ncbi:DNA polymerase III subunit delta [Thermosipho melanesiensis]|uniref:DNA polymerase III, delta n=2 Tax=Thermosipho melanesiensis TaxID=46541 RepID=A6LM55_THEM4|nr:DNA polymerase III subunit delta [Thermosipho melanesiensis]ABR31006.1 DNA polymerase III, delta [Thermosipho melanesiensis BI429]APT74100.1 DNA polymerase III subunit delta [Thermosipho melanesiensis]OOC36047.1 DNA polymerase III subunit delta [Thermosipho melanesiensis]OOC36864.1 DNA polymerase III subunit delta [Thermosipho melanesiensis]OOC37615.1 DNA polymerase III subunit delta [Thermosipho melanesiensis]
MPKINLYGDSEVLKEKFVKKIRSKTNGEYIRVYPGYDVKIIFEKLSNLGLFSKNVIVDVIDFDKFKSSERSKILEINVSSENYLILRTQSKVKKKMEGLDIREFKLPNPWEEDKWGKLIEEFLSEEGIKLDGLAKFLFENVGPNDIAIYNEILKLKVFKDDLSLQLAKELVHKYTVSKLDDFCFMVSKREKDALAYLKEIVRDYEFPVIVYALSNHFITLYKLINFVEVKSRFSWPEILKISKQLKLSSSKVARFLGFKFKNQKFNPKNHLLLYNLKCVENLIKKLYYLDRAVKMGKLVEVELIDFIKEVKHVKVL